MFNVMSIFTDQGGGHKQSLRRRGCSTDGAAVGPALNVKMIIVTVIISKMMIITVIISKMIIITVTYHNQDDDHQSHHLQEYHDHRHHIQEYHNHCHHFQDDHHHYDSIRDYDDKWWWYCWLHNDDITDYKVPEHIGETVYGTFERSHHWERFKIIQWWWLIQQYVLIRRWYAEPWAWLQIQLG